MAYDGYDQNERVSKIPSHRKNCHSLNISNKRSQPNVVPQNNEKSPQMLDQMASQFLHFLSMTLCSSLILLNIERSPPKTMEM